MRDKRFNNPDGLPAASPGSPLRAGECLVRGAAGNAGSSRRTPSRTVCARHQCWPAVPRAFRCRRSAGLRPQWPAAAPAPVLATSGARTGIQPDRGSPSDGVTATTCAAAPTRASCNAAGTSITAPRPTRLLNAGTNYSVTMEPFRETEIITGPNSGSATLTCLQANRPCGMPGGGHHPRPGTITHTWRCSQRTVGDGAHRSIPVRTR